MPITYVLTYVIFSIIHYVADIKDLQDNTRYVYSSLDWGNIPSAIIHVIAAFVLVTLLQFIVYLASMVTQVMKTEDTPNSLAKNNLELELQPVAV